ncbi:MAG: hypothetical protein ACK5IJ_08480 [Mangrovibacterium sp.]
MNTLIKRTLLLIAFVSLFFSCSDDDNDQYALKLVVTANSSEAVSIQYRGEDNYKKNLNIKEYYDDEFISSSEYFSFNASCDDSNTLITVEVYANGVLKKKHSDNYRLQLTNIQMR